MVVAMVGAVAVAVVVAVAVAVVVTVMATVVVTLAVVVAAAVGAVRAAAVAATEMGVAQQFGGWTKDWCTKKKGQNTVCLRSIPYKPGLQKQLMCANVTD